MTGGGAFNPTRREWLGSLPRHWSTPPLRRLARIENGRDYKDIEVDEGGYPVVGSGGAFARAGAYLCEGPSVLLGRKGTIDRPQYVDEPFWAVDTSFFTLVARDVSTRFFFYFALTIPFGYFEAGTALPSMTKSNLYTIRCPLPPLDEQHALADFLDRETAKIDALVAKKQRLVGLLQEKRTALISHAVTKGLDPDVPMRDSGIEWLGQVPASWQVTSLSRVTKRRCDGPFGSGLKSDHYVDAGRRVIRLQNIASGRFDNRDRAFVNEDYYRHHLGEHDVLPGDVLIAGLGDETHPVGRACVAPEGLGDAMVKADCFRFRLDLPKADPHFLGLHLSATAPAISAMLSSGATRTRVNMSAMATRRIAIPPHREQRAIVSYVERTETRIDGLMRIVAEAIERLREYRSALVTAAVTGQIDVGARKARRQAEGP